MRTRIGPQGPRKDFSRLKCSPLFAQRAVLIFSFCALLCVLCFSAEAQQRAKIFRIGALLPGTAPSAARLRRELREIGYVEGKNISFENRYADNQVDRLPALVDELVRLKVDVLVVSWPPAALAAKKATRTIPIVVYNVADPVALGLVDSLARPGGNITGVTIITETLAGKRLELLKETVPKLSRVAMLWNPKNPGNVLQLKQSQQAAHELGLQLYSIEVSSPDKFDSAFREAVKANCAALAMTQDPVFTSNLKLIAELVIKNRRPAIYTRGGFVESGGLMSYGANQAEQDKRAASLIDKILKGRKPAELPVEQPTKFDLVINLKTAERIGLTIPPNVLARADKVIR
jgi:putative tryptophan/tyrosine transport system substrate-binding protein